MDLYIKNMVSLRCKIVVRKEIEAFGLHCINVELGKVEITENISSEKFYELNSSLKKTGLELLEDQNLILVEKMRNLIIKFIYNPEENVKINFSDYMSEKLHFSYGHLAGLFSEVRHMSIAHYFILIKTERVKQLICDEELTLSEIADSLQYSSLAHLSNQFKKTTGLAQVNLKIQI